MRFSIITDEAPACAGISLETTATLAVSPNTGPAGVKSFKASPTRRGPKSSSGAGRGRSVWTQ